MNVAAMCVFIFILIIPCAGAGQIGMTAPDFRISGPNEPEDSLALHRGEVVFLVFWATWCVVCKNELTALDLLYRKYRDQGLLVLGVNVDADATAVRQYAIKNHITYPVLTDGQDRIGKSYRVTGLPTSFLISRDGYIRYRHAGYGKELQAIYESETADLLKR